MSPETKDGPMKATHDDTGHREVHRKNSGRDSANHSPCEAMMASPSLSSISDNHSVVSFNLKKVSPQFWDILYDVEPLLIA